MKEIHEYRRSKESLGDPENLFFTDYDCLCQPLVGEDKRIRLRLNPVANPDKSAGLTHNVILMTVYDDLSYNEDVQLRSGHHENL